MSSEPPRPGGNLPPLYPGLPYPIVIELPPDHADDLAIIGMAIGMSAVVVIFPLFYLSSVMSFILFFPPFLLAIPFCGLLLIVPLAVISLIFCSFGRGSWSPYSKDRAKAGIALSIIALVLFGLGSAVSIVLYYLLTTP